jgi:menaquinone reductase, molybdopterin-binding-like subunit
MGTARRNFLKFAGGLSAGIVFTPVPWKVLDDLSIWTQNWSWLPRPLQGEISYKYTNCTLCPAACGVRAKCVAGQPYQLSGIPDHPVGRPTLCPAGLAAHQLPYATARITKPRGMETAADKVQSAKSILVLDDRPGRCASEIYRRIARNSTKWKYAVAPRASGALASYMKLTGMSAGIDYERVRTILSFGAPVLHGWSTPGRLLARRTEYNLLQVEASQSRTAAFANTWIPIKAGTDDAFAFALANVIVSERLAPQPRATDWREYEAQISQMPLDRASLLTGISAEKITEIARAFVSGPSIALGDSTAIAGLNVLLGANAAIVHRGEAPPHPDLSDIPDSSVDVLIADVQTALPPKMIRRKLTPKGVLIALASYSTDLENNAEVVVPAPSWMELQEDVPSPPDAPFDSFSLAAALLPAREDSVAPVDFVAKLAGSNDTLAAEIDERMKAIHSERRGKLFKYSDGTSIGLVDIKLDEFSTALAEGACWIDEPHRKTPGAVTMLAGTAPTEFTRHETWLSVEATVAPVPMLGKLYRESKLYTRGDVALLNPVTAAHHELVEGNAVRVSTACGSGTPRVQLDPTIGPGIVQINATPATSGKGTALRLCENLALSKAELRRA